MQLTFGFMLFVIVYLMCTLTPSRAQSAQLKAREKMLDETLGKGLEE